MKKAIAVFLAFFATMLLLYFWSQPKVSDTEESLEFTFVAPYTGSGYWGYAASGIVKKCEENGIHVKCIGFTESNADKQIRYIKKAVYAEVDAIITAGIENSPEFLEVLEMAEEAGIPVALIDCDVEASNRLCYVGTDNYAAGQMAGETIIEATQGKGKIAVIRTAQPTINQQKRLEGFYSVIDDCSDLEVVTTVYGVDQYMVIREKILEMLQQYPEVDAVFCTEGYTSNAMNQFLVEEHETYCELKAVTFDMGGYTIEGLEEGKTYATIQQDPYTMGKKAVGYLIEYLKSKIEPPSIVHTDIRSIKPENIEQMIKNESREIEWYSY